MCNQIPVSRFRHNFFLVFSLSASLFFLIGIGPCSTLGLAAQVKLAWEANIDPGVTGYKLYYGTASRVYGSPVDVGNVTQYTFTDIEEGKNGYLAVTAYDMYGTESEFSTELECFSLVPSSGINGSISPSSTKVLSSGMNQTFSILPDAGFEIADVMVDGVSVGTVETYTFSNVTASHSISVSFESVTAQVTLSWAANTDPGVAGYKFYYGNASRTYETPVDVGNVTRYTFTGIEKEKTYYFSLTAYDTNKNESEFSEELECFTLIPATGPNGSIQPSKMLVASRGMNQIFTIGATTGYRVQDILVDGKSVGAATSYSFPNITAHHRIVASFIANTSSMTSASATPDKSMEKKNASTNANAGSTSLNKSSMNSAQHKSQDENNQSQDESSMILAGSGFLPGNGGWIEVLTPQGEEAELPVHIDWPEYNKHSGEIRVATGDIVGDGRNKIIVGLGRVKDAPGIPGGYFTVLDDDFSVIAWGQVEWPEYNQINGETRPTCGDIDGDGIAEIMIGLGPGGDGRIEVFKFVDHQLQHFKWMQSGWPDYNVANGEMRPACADLDGDGKDEVIAGLGPIMNNPGIPGGVYFIFDQTSSDNTTAQGFDENVSSSGWGILNWPDYNRINGEIWPACGDINGDGKDEIIFGLGKQGGSRFEIVGFDLLKNHPQHIAWQQSLSSSGAEIRPACGRLGTDAEDEIVIAYSKGGTGFMEVFGNASKNFELLRQMQTHSNTSQNQESLIWPAVFRPRGQIIR